MGERLLGNILIILVTAGQLLEESYFFERCLFVTLCRIQYLGTGQNL